MLAKYIKDSDPSSKVVFIGPCTAKKAEAQLEEVKPYVDVVLTFEELQALFDSKDIDITTLSEDVLDNASYVFACSDALAHYVMMMYAVACGEDISVLGDKNSNLVQLAKTKKLDFEKHVLKPLFNSLRDDRLDEHCRGLYRKGLLGLDDYSLARLM
jgi:iron only hydrogenase large subunit-like protein